MDTRPLRLLVMLTAVGLIAGAPASDPDASRPVAREGQGPGSASASASAGMVDVQPRPLDWIAPGTVIGKEAPRGWTHLVLYASPRLGVGDVDAVSQTATKYSSMFHFTVLANVRASGGQAGTSYVLERVAMGSAMDSQGKDVITTAEQPPGSGLGFLGRRILEENLRIMRDDFRQVLRTRTMMVFDARAFVLYNKKHARMVIRHALVVAPDDGKLTMFVWLMGSDGKGGYALAEPALQMLPPNYREDRVLSVDADKFTLGIPGEDAFALAHLPRGTPVKFTPTLSRLATTRRFTSESARQLEAELQTRYAPLVVANNKDKNP